MCHAIIKSRKLQMTEGTELPNLEKNRTLGKKENYKYLGILEADTIKHAEMKRFLKNTSGELENHTILKYIAEILLKG